MASLVSHHRSPPNAPDTRNSHRAPRKKASLLSLRKDKSKASDPGYTSDAQHRAPPSSQKAAPYIPPAQPSFQRSRTSNSESTEPTRRGRVLSQASSSKSVLSARSSARGERREPSDQGLYAFPNIGDLRGYLDDDDPDSTVRVARPRPRASVSQASSDWHARQYGSPYRISGSSTFTGVEETPPQTPLDTASYRSSVGRVSVVVAAPIAGVETMDALVDGMNGFGDDDQFMNVSNFPSPSRSKHRKKGPVHHPLYQPPLPTPPPGVVLGRASSPLLDSESEDDSPKPPRRPPRRKAPRASASSKADSSLFAHERRSKSSSPLPRGGSPSPSPEPMKSASYSPEPAGSKGQETWNKTIVPSITEIIQAHAPAIERARTRPSSSRPGSSRASTYTQSSYGHSQYGHSNGHALTEETEPESEPRTADEESDMVSRSSIDSVAQEIQDTIQKHNASPSTPRHLQHAHSFPKRHSFASDDFSIRTPGSARLPEPSLHSSSSPSTQHREPSPIAGLSAAMQQTRPQKIAQYLNSTRLTTLLKLTRHPHASDERPLTVSLSDLGCPTGFPLVVFLGLGCVRHIMGLYDEMADLLGIRLITIDRWGLGRTDARSKAARGIPEWASVVEEVLDRLNIHQCSIMAHSAGAPYALAFANKVPERIRGDICLLAPWIGGGEGAGYKWLKYVPNGILKTAQQAEWKVQGWMLGKPPKVQYQGIGYTPDPPPALKRSASKGQDPDPSISSVYPSAVSAPPRPSVGSSNFSEYDDLADFGGRFESRSTLGARQGSAKRKTSKRFLGRLRGEASMPPSPTEKVESGSGPAKRVRSLKSMTSLKSKASSVPSTMSRQASTPVASPQIPDPFSFELGLGLGDLDWPVHAAISVMDVDAGTPQVEPRRRSSGRRSISLTGPRAAGALRASPVSSTFTATTVQPSDDGSEASYQIALANALIAASHAESSKGTHSDLLQILNHDHQPWGFSYFAYPHRVNVWYGDKDERIAEHSVRWMEKAMGDGKCEVNVVGGADHSLMFRSSIVIEVLERVKDYWQNL
ncbi:hypothetical protein OE88DRAFT_1730764 [Heliocybe sulcata]|uniref:Alpha/beta-hydrolase n=1 Tax=Heliocybe sulcata TaxID=5364 RepID=A0A5C3NLN4_9AGAM|nr:hypothetical protein OE88DRAFT_1730764 [Heliocybe sulcata]